MSHVSYFHGRSSYLDCKESFTKGTGCLEQAQQIGSKEKSVKMADKSLTSIQPPSLSSLPTVKRRRKRRPRVGGSQCPFRCGYSAGGWKVMVTINILLCVKQMIY